MEEPGRTAKGGRQKEENERPGRYSGTAELNSVTRSATPDETYRRISPVNPITSSNDRGCSSGLSYERQDRGRENRGEEEEEERETGMYKSEDESGGKEGTQRNTGTIERARGYRRIQAAKREGKWLP